MRVIELHPLPEGATYSDTYGSWLDVFKEVAESKEPITIGHPPKCWAPLLMYLGADVVAPVEHFHCDTWLRDPLQSYPEAKAEGRQREYVEHICALRPELVDGLWKADCQWATSGLDHTEQRRFVVANYNSLHRAELRQFMRTVDTYEKPSHVKCAVISNCSAQKPYPDPLHQAIIDRFPDNDWHLLIATGVLGVVPQELWDQMPYYDSGLPHFWRCMTRWEDFLSRNRYDRLVVYTEMYSRSLHRALGLVAGKTMIEWVTPAGPFADYLPLMHETWLHALSSRLRKEDFR